MSTGQVIERRELPERRILNVRRDFHERRIYGQTAKSPLRNRAGKCPLALELLSLVLAAVAGFGVYFATGLYHAVHSTAGQILYGGCVILMYMIVIRRGLYWKS